MKKQIKQTNYSSTSTDSFIQTLQNLRREADEHTKKEQADAQERERKLREEIHAAIGFPRYHKRANAFYYTTDQILRYLKMKYNVVRRVSFEEAKDYFPFIQGRTSIRRASEGRTSIRRASECSLLPELEMPTEERVPIDELQFWIAPKPGKSMYAKQIKNGVVFMLCETEHGPHIYFDGNYSDEPFIWSATHILNNEEPPEFLPPELAQKIKKKPIVETNPNDSLQYKKGKKYKKKNKFEIEIF